MDEISVAAIAVLVSIALAFIDHQMQRRRDLQHKLEELYKLTMLWHMVMANAMSHMRSSIADTDREALMDGLRAGLDALSEIEVITNIYFQEHLDEMRELISKCNGACLSAITFTAAANKLADEEELGSLDGVFDDLRDRVKDTGERAVDMILKRRSLILDIWPR